MKKNLLSFFSLVALLGLMTACGNDTPTSETVPGDYLLVKKLVNDNIDLVDQKLKHEYNYDGGFSYDIDDRKYTFFLSKYTHEVPYILTIYTDEFDVPCEIRAYRYERTMKEVRDYVMGFYNYFGDTITINNYLLHADKNQTEVKEAFKNADKKDFKFKITWTKKTEEERNPAFIVDVQLYEGGLQEPNAYILYRHNAPLTVPNMAYYYNKTLTECWGASLTGIKEYFGYKDWKLLKEQGMSTYYTHGQDTLQLVSVDGKETTVNFNIRPLSTDYLELASALFEKFPATATSPMKHDVAFKGLIFDDNEEAKIADYNEALKALKDWDYTKNTEFVAYWEQYAIIFSGKYKDGKILLRIQLS